MAPSNDAPVPEMLANRLKTRRRNGIVFDYAISVDPSSSIMSSLPGKKGCS
jgi:hypothetical protein